MRLTGPGNWGEPADRPQALEILKTAVASGVNFLDTADFYGLYVTNRLIAEALYPYSNDLVICTKVGGYASLTNVWRCLPGSRNCAPASRICAQILLPAGK